MLGIWQGRCPAPVVGASSRTVGIACRAKPDGPVLNIKDGSQPWHDRHAFGTLLQARLIKRWVSSGAQVADALDVMDITVLREIICLGEYQLDDEVELLRRRADTRTREKPSRHSLKGRVLEVQSPL